MDEWWKAVLDCGRRRGDIRRVGDYIPQGFWNITDEDLQQLVGGNYYIGTSVDHHKSLGRITVVGSEEAPELSAGTKITIVKVIRDETSFPCPAKGYEGVIEDEFGPMTVGSTRFRMYIKSPSFTDTLVLHPAAKRRYDKVEWDNASLPICSADDVDKLRIRLIGKSIKWKGQKIGDIEVEPGTILTVVDVSPYDFTYALLTLRLPKGHTGTTISHADGRYEDFEVQ